MSSPVSQEAQQMIAAGAHPDFPDVAALIAKVEEMQRKISALNAERGIPDDPIEGAVKNLLDHVKARNAQLPDTDFSEVIKELEYALQLDSVPRDTAQLVALLIDEIVSQNKHAELSYLPELARTLHKEVLKQG